MVTAAATVPEIRLERVAAADAPVHDAVLGLLRAAYLPFEAVSVMSGTAARHEDSEAFLDVARLALKDGTSIGAFREADAVLVGVAVNFTMVVAWMRGPAYRGFRVALFLTIDQFCIYICWRSMWRSTALSATMLQPPGACR